MDTNEIQSIIDLGLDIELNPDKGILRVIKKIVSGTYKASSSKCEPLMELRIDVDGRRPQNIVSGDIFKKFTFSIFGNEFSFTLYRESFIVTSPIINWATDHVHIKGQIKYYNDPTITNETIQIEIPRVSIFSSAAKATVKIIKSGKIIHCFCLPKISSYYRQVNLEIDRYQGTSFPPDIDMELNPSPTDLKGNTSVLKVFRNSGINLSVNEDDILNDPDGDDAGNNWSEVELHQLMEENFDQFGNRLQWNVYGVVVPRFGDPAYNSGYYGTMFDWGGWQTGDTFLRQGFAIAEDATRGRTSGTLYNSSAKVDRLVLQTFCHELGHAFNLPHSWSRNLSPSTSSNSFMNYPWNYTGGTGGESQFWSNFRWEFDDVELEWMRHGNRKDVIFGGNDWIGNNLSRFPDSGDFDSGVSPLTLSIQSKAIYKMAEPILIQLVLTNTYSETIEIYKKLAPEDQYVTILIKKPDGQIIKYVPPVLRYENTTKLSKLRKGSSILGNVLLNYSAKGAIFSTPGEYNICTYYGNENLGGIQSNILRIRVTPSFSIQEEELAHLLLDHRAAKLIYYKGAYRYPEMLKELENICTKNKKKDPTIAYIQHVLGVHYSKDYKIIKLDGKKKRMVTVHKKDAKKAIKYLNDSIEIISKDPILDEFTFCNSVEKLTEMYELSKNDAKIEPLLKRSIENLKNRKAHKLNIDSLNKILETNKRKK
ncbi:MAG: hypothetical protein ABFR32_06935 [Bacteroidota bacterium]